MVPLIHNAILVPGAFSGDEIHAARLKAALVFPNVSEVLFAGINDVGTFMVPPDGSLQGFARSQEYAEKRNEFLQYLIATKALAFVDVVYGDTAARVRGADSHYDPHRIR